MYFDRSVIEPAICARFFLVFLILLSSNVQRTEGRKCVCTNRVCKEAGVDTCKTRFFCYTELILNGNQEFGRNATRGCTGGATPLLCETKSQSTRSSQTDNVDRSSTGWIHMPWHRLKCCDSHDYCNAEHQVNVSTWIHEGPVRVEPTLDHAGTLNAVPNENLMGSIESDQGPMSGGRKSSDQFVQNRVKPLHVAALVLAIAALISVLAACYVITRFLKTNPYTISNME
ncbi:uncharacterized protein LOC100880908 [Megachile rotundata]|uniref:uncharacterized protein LOC100880908 n=1 Tax=Megachile rotundata TaxID=143995 RepID=UPI000614EE94|nr:PREDICTED: uncharacterized protein LOC100880908 isoform X1 [Megachile rotundata]XP_012142959.1 PREDICTED: uncharacterized protein LOC100880908 isoform X1 [Megachile rotundata]XP_012142960.1 PREDICTED: uncharacterized protein LOC100880908 isoform X1 [Megachile rotundata]